MGLKIRSLSVTQGYLQDARIEFADGLTCVIGPRGSCKSTVVETIRFAFDSDRKRVGLLVGKKDADAGPDGPSSFGMIKATLSGGVARLEVEDDGPFLVEREVESEPRIIRNGVKDVSTPGALERVEIYSQGDLQRIAEDGGRRLDLIDRSNRARISALLEERAKAARELREIGAKLFAQRAAAGSRRQDLKSLPPLAAQLRQLQEQRPGLPPALEGERRGFLARKALLDRVRQAVARRNEALAALRGLAAGEPELRALAAELVDEPARASALSGLLASTADLVAQTRRSAEAQQALDAAPLVEELRARFEEQDRAYHDLQKNEAALNESLRTEDRLRQQIGALEKLAADVAAIEKTEQQLQEQRAARRRDVRRTSDEVFALRAAEVERVNARFANVVHLTLTQGTRTAEYRALLDKLLTGSRLRSQGEIARDLAAKVPPSMLVDAIEAGDSQLLAAHLERDAAQMAKLIGFLAENTTVYELEGIVPDDQLEISMFVDGVAKPVQQLSKGQMATALLPLILSRPADYPLIFDQPEDDLDNRYVYQTLVARARELKLTRQLIFVTHNANIPVLGDADRVIVMRMQSPTRAGAPLTGAVDEVKESILALLEGGAEAFKERQRRYGPLVT